MKAHVIEGGKVTNTIEINNLTDVPSLTLLDASLGGAIGDLWNGSVFSKPLRDIPADKIAQWQAIKAKRNSLFDTGGYLVGTKWFHSDGKSKTQQIGLVLMGAGVPEGLQWKTMDGTFVTMTQTLAGQIFQAAAAQDMALFAAAEIHNTAMLAAADPLAYSFAGGWPTVYAS